MLSLYLETQLLTDLAYDTQSCIRIVLLQEVLKFGKKTVTLDKCFISNQEKLVAFFVTSEKHAKLVKFWVSYNPAHV